MTKQLVFVGTRKDQCVLDLRWNGVADRHLTIRKGILKKSVTPLKAKMTMENHFFFGLSDTSSNSCVSIVTVSYGSVHGFTGSWSMLLRSAIAGFVDLKTLIPNQRDRNGFGRIFVASILHEFIISKWHHGFVASVCEKPCWAPKKICRFNTVKKYTSLLLFHDIIFCIILPYIDKTNWSNHWTQKLSVATVATCKGFLSLIAQVCSM